MRRRLPTVVALAAVVALAVASCGNSESTSGESDDTGGDDSGQVAVDQPGVTDAEIRVGVVSSRTNPLGGNYATVADGVEAYFAMVNDEGGVFGRDMVVGNERDDEVGKNQEAVQAMLTQDDVFAVFVSTLAFTGAPLLEEAGVPTFGWNINPEFTGPENFFGSEGSYLCFEECDNALLPYIVQELGVDKVGALAYNVPQSASCAEGLQTTFDRFPTAEVAFIDTSLTYGTTDYSADVTRLKDEGVGLVEPCMDFNGVNALLQEMRRQDYEPYLYLPNSYNHEFMAEFGDLYEGRSIVRTNFAPFETEDPQPEGLENFLTWMEEIDATPTEPAASGWIGAQMLVEGIEAAGPEFTQQAVVDAINGFETFNADGFATTIYWPDEHTMENPVEDCHALSEVVETDDGDYGFRPHPDFAQPGEPFICFDQDIDEIGEPTFK